MSELRAGLDRPGDQLLSGLLPTPDLDELRRAPAGPPPEAAPTPGPQAQTGPTMPSVEELRASPEIQQLLSGQIPPAAPARSSVTAAPGQPAAPGATEYGMLGEGPDAVGVVGPVPKGVGVAVPRSWAQQQVGAAVGFPQLKNDYAEQALEDARKGVVLGTDNQYYRMRGGPHDPAVIAQTQAAETGAQRGAAAPYEMVTVPEVQPDGSIRQTTKPLDQFLADQKKLREGGGASATPGGPAVGAAVGQPLATSEAVNKQLDEMREKYDAAQVAIPEARHLQGLLQEIGKVGPGTAWKGQISALLESNGFSPDAIKAAGLPSASSVAEAQKLSTDLILNNLKGNFSRVTNMDLGTVSKTVPSADMPLGASNELIGKNIIPRLWRAARMYEDLASDPSAGRDAASWHRAYATWNKNNPLENFYAAPNQAAAPAGGPPAATAPSGGRALRWDPAAGAAVPMGR